METGNPEIPPRPEQDPSPGTEADSELGPSNVSSGSPELELSADELRIIERRRQKQEKGNPVKGFLKRPVGIVTAVLVGAVVVGSAGVGVGSMLGAKNTPIPSENVAANTMPNAQTGVVSTPRTQIENVPEEAKYFVEQYGDMYSDPVSTFYADKEARLRSFGGGLTFVASPEDVAKYEFNDNIEKDGVAFAIPYEFPEISPTPESTADLLNTFVIPWCLEPYMNDLSRNPSQESRRALDNEFMKYCGAISQFEQGEVRESKRQLVQNLLDYLKGVAEKFGTTAVFEIADATYQQNDYEKTVIRSTHIDSVIPDVNNEDVIRMYTAEHVAVNVNVLTFKGSAMTESSLSFAIDQMTLNRGGSYDELDKPLDERDAVVVSVGMR